MRHNLKGVLIIAIIQTLDMDQRALGDQAMLRRDFEVFDRLAQINARDSRGKLIRKLSDVQTFVTAMIQYDLNLPFDHFATLNISPFNGYHLDLSQTHYSLDQRANIYYLFYGLPVFKPLYDEPVQTVAEGYDFDGLGIYWQPVDNGYIDLCCSNTIVETRYSFADAFHLLSCFYLKLNNYNHLSEAQDTDFAIHALA